MPNVTQSLFSALMCLILLTMAPAASAQRSQADGFRGFDLQSAGWRGGYATVAFNDGTRAEQFILRPGDCPRSTGDCSADRERIEFAERNPAQPVGSEVWVAWSIYMPPGTPTRLATNLVLGQFHQRDNSGPELMFQVLDGQYGIKMTDPYRLDDDPMNPIPDFRNVNLVSLASMRGRWTRVMVNARWSRGDDGFIRVYLNGTERWSYNGPTTNSNAPIYFKYGVYRSSVSRCGGPCPELTAYYADVVRGTSREEVE